jgi:hypothetical protein
MANPGGSHAAKQPGTALVALTESPLTPSPLDELTAELQLVGEALIASQDGPVPPEAATGFPKVRKEVAAHSDTFDVADRIDPGTEPEPAADQTILAFPNTLDEEQAGDMPELTEEILARMFANMLEHGIAI